MDRGAPESAGPVAIATFVNPALSVATKRELSNTAKLSVFKSVFVPILTYGHESWVILRPTPLHGPTILAQLTCPRETWTKTCYHSAIGIIVNATIT